jgi:hypothetical protein
MQNVNYEDVDNRKAPIDFVGQVLSGGCGSSVGDATGGYQTEDEAVPAGFESGSTHSLLNWNRNISVSKKTKTINDVGH